ncbi:tyrosine--tRNA ligase [Gordonia sp. (in: high G+C Gram-positive bacteria)]|uniref:tyrosine--tRNA ligase n=1 Tax=Gordonia sp. (in: high G+C Gram-positive bacteria) TaxID=84139 RepID=UPI003C75DBAC
MKQNILDDLIWRGLIGQTTDLDALRAALEQPISLYAGFDPTAASLHAGHLVPLLTLRRFQLAGHRPVVLSGGATGLIGDPRDVGERTMNSADTVADWADKIVGQLQRFVTIDDSANGAVLVNNYEWTGPMTTIEFLRDVGKHFSVNVMLARDTVKRRLESDGISYTEFSYLLLQSNDYLQLFRRYGCVLQIGGSDQWGNIVGGVDLIRKVDAGAAHALTVPLVTSADGKKFGKSTGGGSVWLDPELTSPYSWYQYFMNTADADVVKFLKWFTFLSRDEIEELEQHTVENPHLRTAQKRLAQELTTLIHGADQTAAAELASQALFGRAELSGLDETTLAAALGETGVAQFDAGSTPTIVELLVESGLATGNKAARRAIDEGGAYVNNTKVTDADWTPAGDDLLFGKWLVLRRGKKTFAGAKIGS